MHHNVVDGRRVRVQVLAFGIMPGVDLDAPYIRRSRVTADTVIPSDGLLLEPIAVRAPSGHMHTNNWYEVKLRTEFLSHPLTPGAVTMMPSSFHVTSRENLLGIFEEGIVPGGRSRKVVTFFNAFAPWDPRSYRLAKGRHIEGEKAAFYVPTQVLMEEFEGRITDSGQPATSMTVPFASLRGAWVQDSDMKWHRFIVPTGHEQLIRTVHRPWQYAGRDQVLREARLCAENVDGLDSEAAEIIDIVAAFENKKIKVGGEEEKANHSKLLKYVVLHKVVERAGCVVCPTCLKETPVKYSICLRCKGMMMSHGRKPVEITSAEEEGESDEGEMEVDDDVEIKQEPTAEEENDYKDAVDQGQQEAEAAGRWSFDESEVDYGDEEEEHGRRNGRT